MPAYLRKIEKLHVKDISKSFLENGMNAAAVARQRGTTRQNEAKKIRRKPVQDCINEMLDDPEFRQVWKEQSLAGMSADKSIQAVILVNKKGEVIKADDEGGIMIADHNARHKYWHDLGVAMGVIKPNGNEKGHRIVNIIYGYPTKPLNSSIRQE